MKITLKTLVLLLAFASTVIITGCGGGSDPEPSVEDQQLDKLKAIWNTSDVTLDGASKKTDYTAFVLTLSGNDGADSFGYSTTGRPATSPWPSSGTWTFGDDPETQLTRDESDASKILPMTYTISADGTTLQLLFDFANTTGYTRTSQVKGKWIFTFTKAQ